MHKEDENALKALSNLIAKSVGYVCLTVFACMWLSNCTLQDDIIVNCQESCDSTGTHMESVTSHECICAVKNNNNNIWAIPGS